MPLSDKGLYSIRFVPPNVKPPFLGGMYATSKDMGGPIYGEAFNPESATGIQAWQLFKVPDKEDIYIISSPQWPETPYTIAQGPGPVLPGWGLPESVPTGRNDIVTLKVQEMEWRIEPASDQETYTISPAVTDGRLGVDFAVDLNHENYTLYIRTFPVVENPIPRPTWQFTPAN